MNSPLSPSFHKLVQHDLDQALDNFEQRASAKIADEFFEAFMDAIDQACRFPEKNHPTQSGLRRGNLTRFRFHFLYRITPTEIRVQVLKHDHRHPSFGLRRKF